MLLLRCKYKFGYEFVPIQSIIKEKSLKLEELKQSNDEQTNKQPSRRLKSRQANKHTIRRIKNNILCSFASVLNKAGEWL